MIVAGSRRDRLSLALTTAYGDGLLSEATLAHRMDLLLGSVLVEPDRLIGDLSVRVARPALGARARRELADRLRALSTLREGLRPRLGIRTALGGFTRESPELPTPLLALDWTGRVAELTLGRDPGCDIVLEHLTVSRRHAVLRFRDGRWILHDLSSTNGTAVNCERVVRCRLEPGDIVRVGEQGLIVD